MFLLSRWVFKLLIFFHEIFFAFSNKHVCFDCIWNRSSVWDQRRLSRSRPKLRPVQTISAGSFVHVHAVCSGRLWLRSSRPGRTRRNRQFGSWNRIERRARQRTVRPIRIRHHEWHERCRHAQFGRQQFAVHQRKCQQLFGIVLHGRWDSKSAAQHFKIFESNSTGRNRGRQWIESDIIIDREWRHFGRRTANRTWTIAVERIFEFENVRIGLWKQIKRIQCCWICNRCQIVHSKTSQSIDRDDHKR